jgi:hypothetical protein
MGHRVCQLWAILCVASSLALVAPGDSDSIGGFFLQTLRFHRPHGNHEAQFGYSCRIPQHIGHVVCGVG